MVSKYGLKVIVGQGAYFKGTYFQGTYFKGIYFERANFK